MRIGKAIKRVVALGTGATMLGATILGAMAAADLGQYPSPFVKDGKFNGILVVGANAATEDVIGSIDVATSLQFSSKTVSSVNTGSTGTVSVAGDSWKIETSASKLELGESLVGVKATLSNTELKALGKGTFKNSKGSYAYEQTITVSEKPNVAYVKDTDTEKIAPYLRIANSAQIASYLLTFSTPALTDYISADSNRELQDFNNRKISIMGKDYLIVTAKWTPTGATSGAEITLMGGAISETLAEGESKTYTLAGKDYEVSVAYVGTDGAKFKVTSEGQSVTTNKLAAGDTDSVLDQTIGVSETLYQSYAGGIHSVDFFFGVNKILLKDSTVTATSLDGSLTVGETKASDVDVAMRFSNSSDGTDVQWESLNISYKSPDDIWLDAGQKLSDKFGKYKNSLINWDIAYEGLTTEPTEKISITPSGDQKLQLKVTVADGDVSIPLAYSSDANTLRLGDANNYLVLDTNSNSDGVVLGAASGVHNVTIQKNDYFFLTDRSDDSGKTYVLQYKGFDSSAGDTTGTLSFKNVATGDIIEKSMTLAAYGTATLSLGGSDYTVTNVSVAGNQDDINITVSGNVEGVIITKNKAKITIFDNNESLDNYTSAIGGNTANATWMWVNITESNPTNQLENETLWTQVGVNITGGATEIGTAKNLNNGTVTWQTDPDDSNLQTTMSPYGSYYKWTTLTNSPDKLEVDFPAKQRIAQAFFISGAIQTKATSGAGEVETSVVNKIEVGAAVLDKEVTDIKAQNSIIVGGPCVNDAAADALGLARGSCGAASGVPANKAILKLVSFDNGNVALVVAGWEAKDTRRASRVLADYSNYALSGAEMEVSGTSMTDIKVAAPAPVVAAPATA